LRSLKSKKIKKGGDKMLFIILLAICIIGWAISEKAAYTSTAEFIGEAMCAAAIVALAFSLIIWPASYYRALSDIKQYEAQKETIEIARERGTSELERAAILTQISETNQKLAKPCGKR
jgi:hypothetical protein